MCATLKKEEVRTKIDILIDTMFQVQSSLARLNATIERQIALQQSPNPQQHYPYISAGTAGQAGGFAQLVGHDVMVDGPVWVDEQPTPPRPEPPPEQVHQELDLQRRHRWVFGRL